MNSKKIKTIKHIGRVFKFLLYAYGLTGLLFIVVAMTNVGISEPILGRPLTSWVFFTVTTFKLLASLLGFVWLARASKNAHLIARKNSSANPAWSVIVYFLPILNFYLPYQDMIRIWNDSEVPQPRKNINYWWISVIAGLLSYQIYSVTKRIFEFPGHMQFATMAYIISTLLFCIAIFFGIRIINAITTTQEKWVDKRI